MGIFGAGVAGLVALGSFGSTAPPPDSGVLVEAIDYADPARWVCRPDIADDVCDSGLDATSVAADGTLTPEPFVANPDAPVDCFYVYPTISRDSTVNSDLDTSAGDEGFVVANQAAPLGTACRLFAPVYRQITLGALGGGATTEARDLAYGDVVDAWQHYLATDNGGRGVILVGHSQGAGMLTRLIAEEIDSDPATRDLLVAAYLAGTSLQVPLGRDVGGDFQNVPLCRADDQIGCAVTWSTYRASSPPPEGAIFGRGGEGTEAGCTNPASLSGGRVALGARFPSNSQSSILDSLGLDTSEGVGWLDDGTAVPTPYVTVPGLVTGGCARWSGYNWLEISVRPDPGHRTDEIPGDLTPEWGMHLIDMNVVMGDLQRVAGSQAQAWLAQH